MVENRNNGQIPVCLHASVQEIQLGVASKISVNVFLCHGCVCVAGKRQ